MNGVPRFHATGSGRWHVEKRDRLGWVAVSPQGHAIRQPGQAEAYAYALGRVHEAQIIHRAQPTIVVHHAGLTGIQAARTIEKAIQAHRAMDATGGY